MSVTARRIHQQPRVDKLVREERIVSVVEERSPFYGPGRRVDLVIERQELPGRDLRRAVRSKASTESVAFRRRRSTIWPRLSSGTVKITVMGSNCVMTARVTVPADCTTLPGSTSRSPTWPAIGAVIWQ